MSYPVIETDDCIGCGACMEACPMDVLDIAEEFVEVVDQDSCIGCGACLEACPVGAIAEIADDE